MPIWQRPSLGTPLATGPLIDPPCGRPLPPRTTRPMPAHHARLRLANLTRPEHPATCAPVPRDPRIERHPPPRHARDAHRRLGRHSWVGQPLESGCVQPCNVRATCFWKLASAKCPCPRELARLRNLRNLRAKNPYAYACAHRGQLPLPLSNPSNRLDGCTLSIGCPLLGM